MCVKASAKLQGNQVKIVAGNDSGANVQGHRQADRSSSEMN